MLRPWSGQCCIAIFCLPRFLQTNVAEMDLFDDLQQVAKDVAAAQAASFHKAAWTKALLIWEKLPQRWDRECLNRVVVVWSRRMEQKNRANSSAETLFRVKRDAMRSRGWTAWLTYVERHQQDRAWADKTNLSLLSLRSDLEVLLQLSLSHRFVLTP